ncbi:MAG: nuclear transport factor 2 family protein [Bacteroidales bacterium]
MKKTILLSFAIVMLLSACTTTPVIDKEAETKAITETLNSFYAGASTAEFDLMKTYATEDFTIFDVGAKYDFEGLVGMFKHNFETLQVENMNFVISEVKADIFTDCAFISYLNIATGTIGGQPLQMDFLESALFVKVEGSWKIKFMHSTMIPPPAAEPATETE